MPCGQATTTPPALCWPPETPTTTGAAPESGGAEDGADDGGAAEEEVRAGDGAGQASDDEGELGGSSVGEGGVSKLRTKSRIGATDS